MNAKLGYSLAFAVIAWGLFYGVSMEIAMLVIHRIDPGLFVRLSGRTMALPNWKPWYGWYILQAVTATTGLVGGIAAGWVAWSRDGVITNSGQDADAEAEDSQAT